METPQENALTAASSSYLRSARRQPVRWHEWGSEAFEKARRENKPVLLDIGAVWCHWCHVMDRESYEDPDTAALINEQYIAVKVDRDERPDVDSRYQSAVATISGQSGWPLTAFLTPEGTPYFGGTYFPPEDRHGRPSFQRVLATMADVFANKRDEVEESAGSVLEALEHNETFTARSEAPEAAVLEKVLTSIISQFDPRNGGFGSQPKFPHSGAIDLLIDAATRGGPYAEAAQQAAVVTLEKMSTGGIYDHLAGGFHRYSVDEHWIVPHFEKMAYDNSALLLNYVHAFQTFLKPEFAATARDIVRWMDEWLSDRDLGGFYASQDADDSLDDDGDYFTWTRKEVTAALSRDEFQAFAAYYNLRDLGDMHHNPQKNVLHVRTTTQNISRQMQVSEQAVLSLLQSARTKLYAVRQTRRTPFVDKTVYAGWNGMCISAYLEASRVLGLPDARAFALKSLDRILSVGWSEQTGLARVIAYGESSENKSRVAGVLDDYASVANAALDAWEASGELRYFTAACEIADSMLVRFYDAQNGGFFDTELTENNVSLGVLKIRRKPLQDAPTPSGNSVAATVLLRLSALTTEGGYAAKARETLSTFAGMVEHLGLYAASCAKALQRALVPPVQVCVVGEDDSLLAAATARYSLSKAVIQLSPQQLQALPPFLAETLPHLPNVVGSYASVCQANSCLPPLQNPDELAAVLRRG